MRLLRLLILLLSAPPVMAQSPLARISWTNITADGVPLALGRVCFTPVNRDGVAIAASFPGGALLKSPVCARVVNGTMTPLQLVKSTAASMPDFAYSATVLDASTGAVVLGPADGYGSIQISGDMDLHAFVPSQPGIAPGSQAARGSVAGMTAARSTYGSFEVTGQLSAGFAFGAPTASGQLGVAAAMAACPSGAGCSVYIDPAYHGMEYRGFLKDFNSRSPLPYSTRLKDERFGALNDVSGETVGAVRHVGSQHTLTLFKPVTVSLSRANGVTTVTGLTDDRWCTVPLLIVNASDPSLNSPMSGDGEHLINYDASACPPHGVNFSQPGKDIAAASATLTSYPVDDTTVLTTQVVAGGGSLNGGVEAIGHTFEDNTLFVRPGLNHQHGSQVTFDSKGDSEWNYPYLAHHQEDGGTADDENGNLQPAHADEISIVPQLQISSVAGTNRLYVAQTGGSLPPGGGHKLLVVKMAGGGSAATSTGKVTAVDPAPPSSLDGRTPLLTVDAAVPVSTSWGTFTPILTPPNSDYGIVMSTTLTKTGGAGTPHTGWFCMVSWERYERAYLTVSGGGPYGATGRIRNLMRAANGAVLQWAQGGVCDSPIGGGEAMLLNAATYVSGAGGVAEVPEIWISPDAHTVGYAFQQNNTLRSFKQIAENIPVDRVAVYLRRSGGKVSVNLSQARTWCNHTVAIVAKDASFNTTTVLSCDSAARAGTLAYQQSASLPDTDTLGTGTYDSGLEAFSIYPMEIITNTVDETNAATGLNQYIETEATDLKWAAGMSLEDHVGSESFTAYPLYETCHHANCHGAIFQYGGRGVRGGFDHQKIGNLNPLTNYQMFGGNDSAPTMYSMGGYFGTLFDLTDIYASHNNTGAIFPESILFNATRCPERLNFSSVAPCQGGDDSWHFLKTVVSDGAGGAVGMDVRVDVPHGGMGLYFDFYDPTYLFAANRAQIGRDPSKPLDLYGTGKLNDSPICTVANGLCQGGSASSLGFFTPASSSATCTAGQVADDASYHYVCVATNSWKRVALSSF